MWWVWFGMAVAGPAEFQAWAESQGRVCAWGEADLGGERGMAALLCPPGDDEQCVTVVEHASRRVALPTWHEAATCAEGRPEWETPAGPHVVGFQDFSGARYYLGVRGGSLRIAWSNYHRAGSSPPFDGPLEWTGCLRPNLLATVDLMDTAIVVEGPHWSPRHRLIYGYGDAAWPYPGGGLFRPAAQAVRRVDCPEGESWSYDLQVLHGTMNWLVHGREGWRGTKDAALEVSARAGDDAVTLRLVPHDDQQVPPASATPKGVVAGDHWEIWWVTPEWVDDYLELSWHPPDHPWARPMAGWGPVPADVRAAVPPEEVEAAGASLDGVRQLGVGLDASGAPVATWLFPEGLDVPLPAVRTDGAAVLVTLPMSSLGRVQEEYSDDWRVPLTVAWLDTDPDEAQTLTATSPLKWATPNSFGSLVYLGSLPYRDPVPHDGTVVGPTDPLPWPDEY